MAANTHTNTTHTALITGASRGLGLALARALARDGWALIVDARGADALEAARAELARQTDVIAIAGDVSDAAHRRALADAARDAGGLDALVNNASILGPSPQPRLLDYPLDVLRAVYEANTIAPLALLQAVAPQLKPGARILNITSDAGVEPYEGWGGYGSSKAALEQLSNILAAELPGSARLLGRSGRHADGAAPGSVSRRGHQRPSAAGGECAGAAGAAGRRLSEWALSRA